MLSKYPMLLLFYLQAELQKMRVEMAAMKRDAEHYSRQVVRLYFIFPYLHYVKL